MSIIVREFRQEDLPALIDIWNTVIVEGNAYPQLTELNERSAEALFSSQSYTGVAAEGEEVLGLYFLHPNNVGRCGHIANASYAMRKDLRGKGVGELLVRDSLAKGRELGFKLMQFNAVVSTNYSAIHLYEKIGFKRIGVVPGGFLLKDSTYTDIILYYIEL
jgi:L-amino acid N-acyltransferase YncA